MGTFPILAARLPYALTLIIHFKVAFLAHGVLNYKKERSKNKKKQKKKQEKILEIEWEEAALVHGVPCIDLYYGRFLGPRVGFSGSTNVSIFVNIGLQIFSIFVVF